jgi:predicted dehydrogenase
MTLVGVFDAQSETGRELSAKLGCKCFASPEELIRDGEVEAVVVATPHWQHADLAIAALRAGLHVLCEKPLTVTVAQADEVVEVASRSLGLFTVAYPMRFEAAFRYAKQLLDSGELGPICRCSMEAAEWRSAAYYRSSPWRGTWRGEGGGVLLNQAPHVLDRYVWLCGMPETVMARCDTNLHRIEVEDTASALLRHAQGAHGYIHISTAEGPPGSRTVISCDRGRLVIEDGSVWVTKLRDSIRDRTVTDDRIWGDFPGETREVRLGPCPSSLALFYDNFLATAAGRAELICPGDEGRHAVELANAMILSSARGAAVTLPIDREEYTRLMGRLMNGEASGGRFGENLTAGSRP